MNKFKLSVGIFAFVGLAAINFTQSESNFVNMALASSSDSSSSSSSSSSTAFEEWGYDPTCAPCSSPVEYKTQVICGSIKRGEKELYCMNSDC